MMFQPLNIGRWLLSFGCWLLLTLYSHITLADAQNFYYRVLIDTDINTSNGCEYDVGSSLTPNVQTGFEYFLELSMLAPGQIDQYGISADIISCNQDQWDLVGAVAIADQLWSAVLQLSLIHI